METSDNEGADDAEKIFCADFDEFEIDTLDYDSSICGFMLVLDKQPMKNKYKKVQEAVEEVRKEALDNASNQHMQAATTTR